MQKYLLFFVFAFCLGVSAQINDDPATIDVSGSADVEVAPNEVIFSLDITNVDNDLQAAKQKNDETVARVLALAKLFAVLPQDVKTDYISVSKKYQFIRENNKRIFDEDGDEIGEKIDKGYEISKTVVVKLKDLTKFEDFFSEIVKSGISEVNSISFQTSGLRELRDKARELAMKAAYEKAKAMSGAIGQTIGKAISIIEEEGPDQRFNSNFSANSTVTSGTFIGSENVATFAPGTIKVQAKVKVRFLLN